MFAGTEHYLSRPGGVEFIGLASTAISAHGVAHSLMVWRLIVDFREILATGAMEPLLSSTGAGVGEA
jgi:hypothetical protein